MTAEEKAKDLMAKMDITYYYKLGGKNSQSKGLPVSMRHEQIKQCALIAVDEIIKSNPCYEDSDRGGNFMWNDNTYYWQEVKEEINKL